jgi:hypothetical protein
MDEGLSHTQGHYLNAGQNKHIINTNVNALIGIRTHDPNVLADEDSSCLGRAVTLNTYTPYSGQVSVPQLGKNLNALKRNVKGRNSFSLVTCWGSVQVKVKTGIFASPKLLQLNSAVQFLVDLCTLGLYDVRTCVMLSPADMKDNSTAL